MLIFSGADALDPDETKIYRVDWFGKLGDGETIDDQVVEFVEANGASKVTDDFGDTSSRITLTGGTIGSRAVLTVRVFTSSGQTLEQSVLVDVIDNAAEPAGESERDRLVRLLEEARTALHDLQTGRRVVEVVRDGRRMRYQSAERGELASYAAILERDIAALDATSNSSRRRRRFIPVAL